MYRRSRLLLPILFAIVVSACIGSNTPAAAPQSSPPAPSASVASNPPSSLPAEPSSAPASLVPETAAPTPTVGPSGSPISSPSGGAGSVDGCAGSDENRTFWANAAKAMGWPVYCPSLPVRWVVVHGSYKGQALDITYRGPGGATLQLLEGAFCKDADGCVPDGNEFGTAGFGDQTATLLHLADGRIAAVVDRGDQISWLAIGDGLDDAQFADFTGALIRLD